MKLSHKVLLLFLLFFTALFISLMTFLHWLDIQQSKGHLVEKYNRLSANAAEDANQMIQNRNPANLYYVLTSGLEKEIDLGSIKFLRIVENNGQVLFSMNIKEEKKQTQHESDVEIFHKTANDQQYLPITILKTENDQSIIDVTVPFRNDTGFYILRAGYEYQLNVPINYLNLLILFLFLSSLSFVLVVLIQKLFIGPIEVLTFSARQIAKGKTDDFSFVANRNDEIGHLRGSLQELVRQLRLKQEELAEKERLAVLGKGTGRLTHNISNLLNPLDHYFNKINMILKKDKKSIAIKEALEPIERHVNLIRNDLNRLKKAVPDQPYRESYPLSVLIEAALGRVIVPENVRVKKVYGGSIIYAMVDPEQMTEVFYNIILNAFQAMTEKGGVLKIRIVQEQNKVHVHFKDDGCGIPQDQIQDIFQFFMTTKKSGMGIGLSSAMEIVRQHGGVISVESSEEWGSDFKVSLPLSS